MINQFTYDDARNKIGEIYEEAIKKLSAKFEITALCALLKIADVDDEAVRFFTMLIDKGCPAKAITDTLLEFGKEIKDD